MLRNLLLLTALAALTPPAFAGPRVDLSQDDGRGDVLAPGWEEWRVPEKESSSVKFDEVTVTLQTPNAKLTTQWWKPGFDYPARMSSDGVTVAGSLELVLSGLPAGKHSLGSYHSAFSEVKPARITVAVQSATTSVGPTTRVKHDADAATAFIEFNVEEGKDVVVTFTPKAGGRVVLNGFEIDRPDLTRRAMKPVPFDDDEHALENPVLGWRAATGASSHRVYFGTDALTVAKATRETPEFLGEVNEAGFPTANLKLNNRQPYFWRVDTVHPTGLVRGEVWRFWVRHLAFPTAEGYGRFAKGGRGGRVIHVTNLNDSGPGSLRNAVQAEGPRTVVFDVSGLITLESPLVVRNPYLTIAGQTAPAKGICIRKYNFGLYATHDVIIRHIRVRPGNISGKTLDGMGMAYSDHCIIDHCSISWTIDEAFSSRGAKNITLQRCLISEAINAAGHRKYPKGTQHGYAASIGGMTGSFHHNLLANCAGRNWSLAGGLDKEKRHTGWLDIRNNVVFNWKDRATDGGASRVQFVNNYYKPGPATRKLHMIRPELEWVHLYGPQKYYIAGNVLEGHVEADDRLGGFVAWNDTPLEEYVCKTPFFESHVETHSADVARRSVLANVGCNVPRLDNHDQRILEEVRTGKCKHRGSVTGLPGLPDSQDDVGGWERYPEVRRPASWDTDRDGMPDNWEKVNSLDPNDPADSADDRDNDGFTNLEEYLGSLTGEFAGDQR